MTVTYLHHIYHSGLGFYRILGVWQGSLYKGIWKDLLIYCLLYALISIIYRFVLIYDESSKESFERWCIYVSKFEENLPLDFILGFYVTQVVHLWWSQYSCLVWPDTLAMDLAAYLPGQGRAKQIRRQIVRQANLSTVMALRKLSTAVAKRFPTYQHLVQAGLMTEKEQQKILDLETVTEGQHQISWAPILWAQASLRRAWRDKLISAPNLYDSVQKDLLMVADKNRQLFNYAWINIPLVYTQLVQIAVHMYFFLTLFGKQYLSPTHYLLDTGGDMVEVSKTTPQAVNFVGYDSNISDLYVPYIAILKFVFYFGWLHVSEVLINPLGEDDEDFDVNYLINRNVQISYLMVDGEDDRDDEMEEMEDPFNGCLPSSLPHTRESLRRKSTVSRVFPTDIVMNSLTEEAMALAGEEDSLLRVRTVPNSRKTSPRKTSSGTSSGCSSGASSRKTSKEAARKVSVYGSTDNLL